LHVSERALWHLPTPGSLPVTICDHDIQGLRRALHDQFRKVRASKRSAPPASRSAVPLRAGASEVSFEQIYELWFEHVSRWVLALGAREADCIDLVQEVFIVVYRRLAEFDGDNVSGWLYQIARRKVRDYRRLAWVKHLFGTRTVAPFDAVLMTAVSPLDELGTSRKLARMRELLERLTPDQRAAFVLFEIEGRSGTEIAELQQVPLNTVWGRIHAARKLLRAQEGELRLPSSKARR
jgi:RNA polymerase sigma-70 factor, ECF subfamily